MGDWPFIGRDEELVTITEVFIGSTANAVVIRAGAGYGKTALARRALSRLDCRTEWVWATRAAAAVPFGALPHLLPPAWRGGPLDLIRALASQMDEWGGRHGVALGVDDAHLLDDSSAAAVVHLITNSLAFAVVTVRTGEPIPDAVAALCKNGHAVCLDLPPLPPVVVDRLIDHSAAGIDVLGRQRLHDAALGNPMALRELLHGAVPGGLNELVTSKLDSLDAGVRAVVELVACGEPLTLPMLEQVAESDAIASAEHSGLVTVEHAEARLGHPLYGDVLRARMPHARARQVWRQLASVMLSAPLQRQDDTLRAALWQVNGGEISQPDVVRAGAWQAIGRANLAVAERLARAARQAQPGIETDRLLAEILEYRGKSAEAASLLRAAKSSDVDTTRWMVTKAESLYWGDGHLAEAERLLRTAEGDPHADGSRSWLLFFDGRCAEALDLTKGLVRATDQPQAAIWAAASGAASSGFLWRLADLSDIRGRGLALAATHQAELPWARAQLEFGVCLGFIASGELLAAERVAADEYQVSVEARVPMMVTAWNLCGGLVAAARGHLDDATDRLSAAAEGYAENDSFRLTRCCLAALGGVAGMRGDAAAATRWFHQADLYSDAPNRLFGPWIEGWRAWAAFANGDMAAAMACAERAVTLAERAGFPVVTALARLGVARLGGPVDTAEPAGTPMCGAFAGLSTKDGQVLVAAAGEVAALGHDLLAAELMTSATRVFREQGHRSQAGLAAAKAAALAARCSGARTPLLDQGEAIARLSPREREIVLLAATHSSKQIALRLGLALATVNNNLARAYAKLGVTGRTELRALLDQSAEPAARPDQSH